jgi:hypothetical protein
MGAFRARDLARRDEIRRREPIPGLSLWLSRITPPAAFLDLE